MSGERVWGESISERRAGRGSRAGRAFGARPKLALDSVLGPWRLSVLRGGENSLGGHRVFARGMFLEGSRGDTCKSKWWLRPVRGLLSSPSEQKQTAKLKNVPFKNSVS